MAGADREPDPPVESRTSAAWAETVSRQFRAVEAGEAEALEALYDTAAPRIFGLALWRTGSLEDASDVVQEVFLRLAARRGHPGAVAAPGTWLLAVAHHAAIDVVRKRRSGRRTEPLDTVPYLAAPETDAARGVDAARASRLVSELPPPQRDTVYLHHFAGCSFAEIGRITGVPTFTAASRYRLGLARLRRLMEVPT